MEKTRCESTVLDGEDDEEDNEEGESKDVWRRLARWSVATSPA